LLYYYAVNKQLPTQLADLAPLDTSQWQLTCPASGEPYVYVPDGLRSAGHSRGASSFTIRRPRHVGSAGAILMADQTPGGS